MQRFTNAKTEGSTSWPWSSDLSTRRHALVAPSCQTDPSPERGEVRYVGLVQPGRLTCSAISTRASSSPGRSTRATRLVARQPRPAAVTTQAPRPRRNRSLTANRTPAGTPRPARGQPLRPDHKRTQRVDRPRLVSYLGGDFTVQVQSCPCPGRRSPRTFARSTSSSLGLSS